MSKYFVKVLCVNSQSVNMSKYFVKVLCVNTNSYSPRFFCASVVDFRTRLEFHGERRVWDGRFIKKVIKGNSALYVFVEEVWEQGHQ